MFSVTDIFPQVSLNFAGGASMILNPPDYLVQQNSIVSYLNLWTCIHRFPSTCILFSFYYIVENLSDFLHLEKCWMGSLQLVP